MPQQAAPPVPCSRCHALVHADDLDQGFAILVQGKPVCKVCVDTGQQVGPPQRQSTKQIEVQNQHIARFSDLENPDLNRFTFLTAGHITLHRKIVREQGSFNPPELKKEHETKAIKKSTARHTKKSEHDVITSHGHERRHRVQQKKGNPVLVFMAVAVIVIGVLVGLSLTATDSRPTIQGQPRSQATPRKEFTRKDFPNDSIEAWRQASITLAADNKILKEIAGEIETQSAKQFQEINALLEAGNNDEALNIAQSLQIPRHKQFELLAERQVRMQAQCKDAVQAQQQAVALRKDPEPKDAAQDNIEVQAEAQAVVDNEVAEHQDDNENVAKVAPANPVAQSELAAPVVEEEPTAKPADDLQASISRLPADFEELKPLDQLRQLIGDIFRTGSEELRLKTHGKLKDAEAIARQAIKDRAINAGGGGGNFFRFFFKDKSKVRSSGFMVFRMRPHYQGNTNIKVLFSVSHGKGSLVECFQDKGEHIVKLRRDIRNKKWDVYTRIPDADIWQAYENDGFVELAIDWDLSNYEGGIYLNGKRIKVESRETINQRFSLLPVRAAQPFQKVVFGANQEGKLMSDLEVLYFRIFDERKVTGDRYDVASLKPLVAKPIAPAHEADAWQEQELVASLGVSDFMLIDANNDGHLDIFASGDGRKMKVCHIFINDGTGNYAVAEPHVTEQPSMLALAAGDITGDGVTDLVCVEGDDLVIYRHGGGKQVDYKSVERVDISLKHSIRKILIADMNNDSHADLVLLLSKSKDLVLFNDPKKPLKEWAHLAFGSKGTIDGLIMDVDNDDKPDVVTVTHRRNKVLVYHLNKGNALEGIIAKENIVKIAHDALLPLSDANGLKGVLLSEKSGKNFHLHTYQRQASALKKSSATDWSHAPLESVKILTGAYDPMDNDYLVVSSDKSQVFVSTASGHSGPISAKSFSVANDAQLVDVNKDGLLDCLFMDKSSSGSAQSLYLFIRKAEITSE